MNICTRHARCIQRQIRHTTTSLLSTTTQSTLVIMQIFVTSPNDNVFGLEVAEDMAYEDLLAFVEMEASVAAKDIVLTLNGTPVRDSDPKATIGSLGLVDNSMLLLTTKRPTGVNRGTGASAGAGLPSLDFSSIQIPVPGSSNGNAFSAPQLDPRIEKTRTQILASSASLDSLKQSNPDLAAAINDPHKFKAAFTKLEADMRAKEVARKQEMQRLYANPDNEDNQKRILEMIHQDAVQESFQNAMEHHPEMFVRTDMLYISAKINSHEVKAFVDTGAQMTIMSEEFCSQVGLSHMIDKQFAGIARGVGSGTILGRVHSAPLQIGSSFFPCSVSIIEGNQLQFILGLDMLKRFKANVNLRSNELEIGEEKTPFLEGDALPEEFANLGKATEAPVKTEGGKTESFKDEDISSLMSLGHSRDKAVAALKQADGNVEVAASILFMQ